MSTQAPLLSVEKLTVRFGGLVAVKDVSFEIRPGELVGLIGPNGAGKTTVFNLITGIYAPTDGRVVFAGKPTSGLKLNTLTKLGVARTFQNIRLFRSMSVADNVRTAFQLRQQSGFVQTLLRGGKFANNEAAVQRKVSELLKLFDLERYADSEATSLPYGHQRRLEIVRALATEPRLLLLDEPACGMNPSEKENLMHLIRRVRDEFQVAILLVEHSMRVVMGVCERIVVLHHGEKIAEGTPEAVRAHPEVIEAYLGTSAHH